MSEPGPAAAADDALPRLHTLLDELARRLSGRSWATPRMMQVDAGEAISLAYDAPGLPNRDYLISTLSSLLRELGQPRPDLYRYIVAVEGFVSSLNGQLGHPPGPDAPAP